MAIVRIAFGAIGMLVVVRTVANGWVESLYAGPAHHFTYPGFGWVSPPSALGTYVLLAAIGAAAAFVALGRRTRLALAVFLVGFTWLELIEVTTYLNHYWFVTLLGTLLLAVPSDAAWSLTARRRGTRTVPMGAIWLVRFQVSVVYVFAGLAKLNADWLLHGVPLRLWLPAHTDVPILGVWLDEPWVALGMSWGGALFDCLIIPALCWRRTRPFAWCVLVVFHVATWMLFPIGVFPWLMIAVSTVFFAPDWPRRVAGVVSQRVGIDRPPAVVPQRTQRAPTRRGVSVLAIGVAIVWAAFQILIPLRHLVVPGDYRWSNEGYRFSWLVLLTEKGGDVSFRVRERGTEHRWVETAEDLYTPNQWRAMTTEPELIRQAAHAIAAQYAREGRDVEVRADAFVALNGRPAARLLDPTVDLAHEPWRTHQPWILPAPDESFPGSSP